MEYTPGIKINKVADLDRDGVDRQLLAKRTVESYLQQLLTYGFFHAGLQISPVPSIPCFLLGPTSLHVLLPQVLDSVYFMATSYRQFQMTCNLWFGS